MTNQPFNLRPSQQAIIDYDGGQMGVSAVPGAGKTFTLSHLAAALVQKLSTGSVIDAQEVLIVTFSNSAVNSFKKRIADILQRERGLLPYTGYRVRTLHGLAHDIVRERPTLVGLAEDFEIVDERVATRIRTEAIHANLRDWQTRLQRFLDDEMKDNQEKYVYSQALPEMLLGIMGNFISRAKESLWTAHELQMHLEHARGDYDLARFAARVYGDYQRQLSYRGAVDFDDLIRLALLALRSDADFLARLQRRWVYILEDEAQDSSHLQEEMLKLLTGEQNWVRVGDPNQAINTTFTTANPEFLRNFLERDEVAKRPLQVSGRSSRKIIGLANELVRWTVQQHPVPELRRTAFYAQDIFPTKPDDPQQNPSDTASNIYIHDLQQRISPEREVQIVVDSIARWLPNNPDKTVAVLVPENSRGFKVAEALKNLELPYEELLRSTSQTRSAATKLMTILTYLANPSRPRLLAQVYQTIWIPLEWGEVKDEGEDSPPRIIAKAIGNLREIETLIAPIDESEWDDLFEQMNLLDLPEAWLDDLVNFIHRVQRWLDALELPVDQMVLTIGQDIFRDAPDIALGYKIASLLKSLSQSNPSWRLLDYVNELKIISNNQRRFIGFDDATTGYEPPAGQVTIATMHAAKGLEWDRVYLMALNNYSFPSAMPYDDYIGEKWFVREDLNLNEEALAQLQAIVTDDMEGYSVGVASEQARIDYAAERLRLIYVGITRAKSDLIITWNMGRFWDKSEDAQKQPALPLYNLKAWLDGQGF